MQEHAYLRLVRGAALYDLVATAVIAIPFAVPVIWGLLGQLDALLGFNTAFQPLDPTAIFFFNLAGCAVVAFAVFKWKHPSVEVGRFDAAMRFGLVACQILAVMNGATPILLGISAVLLVLAVLESLPVRGHAEAVAA